MGTREENLKIKISGESQQLLADLNKDEARFRQYENHIVSSAARMGSRVASSISSVLKSPLSIMGGSAAILYAGKQVMDYEANLARLGIQSGTSAEELVKLRSEINNISLATGHSRQDILEGLSKMHDETGSLETSRALLQDIAIASAATGTSMESMGNLAGQLQEKLGLSKEEINETLNLLSAQGKMKGFDLGKLAENSERIFAAASRFNMTGMNSMRSFSAFLAAAKESSGGEAKAVAGVEGILTRISELKGAFGFKFTDSKGDLKDIETIIKGIISATGGNQAKIDKLFGGRGGKALAEMAKEFRTSGTFSIFDAFKTADAGKPNQILQDMARYTNTAQYQLKELQNGMMSLADAGLSPIIAELTAEIKKMTDNPKAMKDFADGLKAAAQIALVLSKIGGFGLKTLGKAWFFGDDWAKNLNTKKSTLNNDSFTMKPQHIPQVSGLLLSQGNNKTNTPEPKAKMDITLRTQFDPGNISMLTTVVSDNTNVKITAPSNRGSLQ